MFRMYTTAQLIALAISTAIGTALGIFFANMARTGIG